MCFEVALKGERSKRRQRKDKGEEIGEGKRGTEEGADQ
jgi:hypothetical protein